MRPLPRLVPPGAHPVEPSDISPPHAPQTPPFPAIGAFHAQSWTGLVFCPGPGEGFAFRFSVSLPDGSRADGEDFFWIVHEVGSHAPDGSYARVAFDLGLPLGRGRETPLVRKPGREPGLVLEWGRMGEAGAVGRVSAGFGGELELVPFFPWDWDGEWEEPSPAPGGVPSLFRGRSRPGGFGFALAWRFSPPGAGERSPILSFSPPSVSVGKAAPFSFRFPSAPGTYLSFSAALGRSPEAAEEAARRNLEGGVLPPLASARETYEARRVHVDGVWRGLAESITNNLHWMVLLKPETGEKYVPAGRRWIFPAPDGSPDHWTVFGWDSYFNALELAVESRDLAMAALRAGLATQYPSGCVPNWRGRFGGTPDRSQPPVGSFALAKLLARFGNTQEAAECLPALERWSAFWRAPKGQAARRDGNGDGLFEWGSDTGELSATPPPWEVNASGWQRAAWESGQDDLPNWEEAVWDEAAETFDLASVDLNAYLALDFESLAWVASALGDEEKAEGYRRRWGRLRDLMNETLWNEERGLYLDRKWDGSWSRRVAASNFLPLVAGVPTPEQASRLLETLLDPAWFWGDFVLPTISRNDPAFPQQQYWRGTIWPPMNYLVYQGLKRYGFDEAAGELAQKSVALFLKSWHDYQLCRENYDSRTGEGGGQRYQSWGPLFALIGLEEFLDVTPWGGLTLGSLRPPGETTLRRLRALGRSWTVALSPRGMRVDVDGRTLLSTDAPCVLREVLLGADSFSCRLHAARGLGLRVEHPPTPRRALVDGQVTAMEGRFLRVPAGRHLLRLEG